MIKSNQTETEYNVNEALCHFLTLKKTKQKNL